jgi:hypothetical protein
MDTNAGDFVRFPDFEAIQKTVALVTIEALRLRQSRPDCQRLGEKYDEAFNSYSKEIADVDQKISGALKDLEKTLEDNGYDEWKQKDWERFKTEIEEWRNAMRRAEALKDPVGRRIEKGKLSKKLNIILDATWAQIVHKDYDESQLLEARDLRTSLEEMKDMLAILSKSTHEWMTETNTSSTLTIKTGRIRGAEGSSDAPLFREAEEEETVKVKCTKCGKLTEPIRRSPRSLDHKRIARSLTESKRAALIGLPEVVYERIVKKIMTEGVSPEKE